MSFKQRMEGYLEAIPPKVGPRRREITRFILKMIKPGSFLSIIGLNLRYNKIRSNMLFSTITKDYVCLEVMVILGYVKEQIILKIAVLILVKLTNCPQGSYINLNKLNLILQDHTHSKLNN